MAANPCLPFCHWPTFTDPCVSSQGEVICCIKFTVPCGGTMVYDGYLLYKDGDYYYKETPTPYDLVGVNPDITCQDNTWGGTPIAIMYNNPETDGDIVVLFFPAGGYLIPASAMDIPSEIAPDIVLGDVNCEFMGYTASCPDWPDRLTEISGIEETDDIYEGEALIGSITRKALPHIRWKCDGNAAVVFEVGWCVIALYAYVSPVSSLVLYQEFVPISVGVVDPEWWSGPPFDLLGVETAENRFDSLVTPVLCFYEPCGDPLDCFASCISGSKDCDGTTPAHKPVIYITFDTNSASCCISGTFAMRWTGAKYEITDPPSCLVDGCVITIYASLSCYLVSGGDPEYGAGENTAILRIEVTDGSGCTTVSATYVVGLSCSGGILNNNSGTIFMDMVCNDSHETDLDWVLHG